jgi:Leucine-rich repeat (LRR) protein
VQCIPVDFFSKLSNPASLTHVDFTNNSIVCINSGLWAPLVGLQVLRLEGNGLVGVTVRRDGAFDNLTSANLTYTGIRRDVNNNGSNVTVFYRRRLEELGPCSLAGRWNASSMIPNVDVSIAVGGAGAAYAKLIFTMSLGLPPLGSILFDPLVSEVAAGCAPCQLLLALLKTRAICSVLQAPEAGGALMIQDRFLNFTVSADCQTLIFDPQMQWDIIPTPVTPGGPRGLQALNLKGNHLTAAPGPESLGALPGLESLDLGKNDITTLPKGAFAGMPLLSNLSLSGNKLQGNPLATGAFEGVNLKAVDLSFNFLDCSSLEDSLSNTSCSPDASSSSTDDVVENCFVLDSANETELPDGVSTGWEG